jgi:hypothetical protein
VAVCTYHIALGDFFKKKRQFTVCEWLPCERSDGELLLPTNVIEVHNADWITIPTVCAWKCLSLSDYVLAALNALIGNGPRPGLYFWALVV